MREPLGGFIFIPADQGISFVDVVEQALRTFDASAQAFAIRFSETEEWQTPPDDLVASLATNGYSTIETQINGLHGLLTFEKDIVEYYVVGVKIYEKEFLNPGSFDSITTFVDSWVDFCVDNKADFGYFGNFASQQEIEYRDDKILILLLTSEIDYLAQHDFWLTYLSADTAQHWHPDRFLGFHRRVDQLPSGGVVLHGGRGDNPVTAESAKR